MYFCFMEIKESDYLLDKDKYAYNKKWFEEQCNYYRFSINNLWNTGDSTETNSLFFVRSRLEEFENFNLYNGRLDIKKFLEKLNIHNVPQDEFKLPYNFEHRDILSKYCKILEDLIQKLPFDYKVMNTNPNTQNHKKNIENSLLQKSIVDDIDSYIRFLLKKMESKEELTPEQEQQMQEKINKEVDLLTPDEIKNYMQYSYKDEYDVLANDLMSYILNQQDVEEKINQTSKDFIINARPVVYIGIENGRPVIRPCNSINFQYSYTSDNLEIHKRQYCFYTEYLDKVEFIRRYKKYLTKEEISLVIRQVQDKANGSYVGQDNSFQNNPIFNSNASFTNNGSYGSIQVTHVVWRYPSAVRLLTYADLETGEIFKKYVSDDYKLNKLAGDLKIENDIIEKIYETTYVNVLGGLYIKKQEVEFTYYEDGENEIPYLPYISIELDGKNAKPISLIGRMKSYQYKIDLFELKASDWLIQTKGNILALDSRVLSISKDSDISKELTFMDNSKLLIVDPTLGNDSADPSFDIRKYINTFQISNINDANEILKIIEYYDELCGLSVGISKQLLGQISQYEKASNAQKAIIQSSSVLGPYFRIFNYFKKIVLNVLLQCTKDCFIKYNVNTIKYTLKDSSIKTVNLDKEKLSFVTIGLFVTDNGNETDILNFAKSLGQAALQNQQADLDDLVKLSKATSSTEAAHILQVARSRRDKLLQQQEESKNQQAQQLIELKNNEIKSNEIQKELDRKQKIEEIVKKGEIEFKLKELEIQSNIENNNIIDKNDNGIPDVLDLAKHEADVYFKKEDLELRKEKLEIEKKKLEKGSK